MGDLLPASTAPIMDDEIAWACKVMGLPANAFSGEDGTDPRLQALRSLSTLDIEACPGSGKTTLLVAKLAILGNRWTDSGRGICVLSHTNAAREEIGNRLSTVSAGHKLLGYPHFVGTIHSFVNEFLALPWLRSKGSAIKMIDDWAAYTYRWDRVWSGLQEVLKKRTHENPIYLLDYTDPDFRGGAKQGLPEDKPLFKAMLKSCRLSAEAGYYCYDDMFVWASELIDRHPGVIETIRSRFPIVFFDEVQDNSERQSAFLYRLFMDPKSVPVVRQRFGDSNQAIYAHTGATGAVTDPFPSGEVLDLPNSFRFGQPTADLAAPFGVRPQKLVGLGPSSARILADSQQPTLFLFEEPDVHEVLSTYARHIIEKFEIGDVERGEFTAICGVHRSEKEDKVPRHMRHYAPAYNPDLGGRQPKPQTFAEFLISGTEQAEKTGSTFPVVKACAEAIVTFLKRGGLDIPIVLRPSAHRYVLDVIKDEEVRQQYQNLCDLLILARGRGAGEVWQEEMAAKFLKVGAAILGEAVDVDWAEDFFQTGHGALPEALAGDFGNRFRYPAQDPKVSIRLGSIHGIKGETHTATLVLESFRNTHSLKNLKPWLLGKKPQPAADNTAENDSLKDRLKLHYVGMTRPSHLLCLAMRRDSLTDAELEAMRSREWNIVMVRQADLADATEAP